MSNSHTELGWILFNDLGGVSITDRLMASKTDKRTEAITIFPFFFFKRSVGINTYFAFQLLFNSFIYLLISAFVFSLPNRSGLSPQLKEDSE